MWLVTWFFFFNDTATTEIYTLSLHDALPIYSGPSAPDRGAADQARAPDDLGPGRSGELGHARRGATGDQEPRVPGGADPRGDRKSTRLNSSHANISYAVFCLKKKKTNTTIFV